MWVYRSYTLLNVPENQNHLAHPYLEGATTPSDYITDLEFCGPGWEKVMFCSCSCSNASASSLSLNIWSLTY